MINKEKIIQEYLTSTLGYRELAKKYGISRSAIHRWVLKFQGIQCASVERWRKKKPYLTEMVKPTVKAVETTDAKLLRKKLIEEQQRSAALLKMIEIAEKEFKISIRKKSGAKRSVR